MTASEHLAPHPLFPIDEEDDAEQEAPQVAFITVSRFDNGQRSTAPRIFRAEELPSLEVLHALFGGGKYELLGRDAGNARIVAKRAYSIPGPPKPMFETPEPEASSTPPGLDVAALLKAMQPQQASGFNMQAVLGLLGVLAPVFTQYLQNQAAAQQAQTLAQQQFLATILTTSQANNDKLVSVMGSLYAAKPSGGSGDGSFRDGMQFMQDFIAGQMEGRKEGDDEPSLKDMFSLAEAYMRTNGKAPTPAVGSGESSNGAAS